MVLTMLLRFFCDRCLAMNFNDLLVPIDEAPAAMRLAPIPAHAGPKEDDPGKDGGEGKGGTETGTITKTRPKTKRPSLYRVLLLNDDYTPMEFVVLVLQDVFNKSREEAMQIMLHVHQKGVGECGVYPYEVAETKVTRVMDTARKNQHPLQCVMEKQ
jgi:ATP-dependent Clp protease adaptor protein ClpS